MPFGKPPTRDATFFQVFPPSRVTCRFPSSVPAHRTLAETGDSLMVVIVGYSSTPSCRESVFLSGTFSNNESLLRSTSDVSCAPSRVQESPRLVDLNRKFPP